MISRLSEKFTVNDAAYYSFDSSATFKGPYTDSGAPGIGSYKVINNMPYAQYAALTLRAVLSEMNKENVYEYNNLEYAGSLGQW